MEIITAANNWAKAEIISSIFFMLFGIVYLLIAIYIRQLGTTPLTKALIIPLMVAGGLLFLAGISFYLSNKSKLASFEKKYNADPAAMLQAEMATTTKTIKTYENVAIKVFPALIVIAALLAILVSDPMVRAICISVIAFLFVLVLLDSQALKRMKTYHQQIELAQENLNN